MINEANDYQLRKALNQTVEHWSVEERDRNEQLKDHSRIRNFEISDHDFQTIKVQLRALGLITKSQRPRSIKDTHTYWTLTPYGDQVLTGLRAIPKDVGDNEQGSTEPDGDTSEPQDDPQV